MRLPEGGFTPWHPEAEGAEGPVPSNYCPPWHLLPDLPRDFGGVTKTREPGFVKIVFGMQKIQLPAGCQKNVPRVNLTGEFRGRMKRLRPGAPFLPVTAKKGYANTTSIVGCPEVLMRSSILWIIQSAHRMVL
jgi:hypothetical protein